MALFNVGCCFQHVIVAAVWICQIAKEIIAKRGEKKTEEHTTMTMNGDDKTSELEYKAEIKPDCDWILKNFHDRALHRGSEMDGLLTAKSMLQGAKPAAALIEQGFDDNAFSGIRFLGVK